MSSTRQRILVSEAGGTLTRNFVSSLKYANEECYFIGVSCNKYDLCLSNANENHLVPSAKNKDFIPILRQIIQEAKPDFFHSQHDLVIKEISRNREKLEKLGVKLFLPSKKTVANCVDKFRTYKIWEKSDITVPKTIDINTYEDLEHAFNILGKKVWLRFREGGGGFGAVPTNDIKFAKIWIDYYNGWGKFTASECLTQQTVTWMSIWKEGELIVGQGRKRLYWLFSDRNLSGVTGITGTGVTVSDAKVDEIALKAIHAIDEKPNGIFSVDLTYDKEGIPNPTEINIGRFFTTHNFFTKAGLNLPEIYLKLAFDEKLPPLKKKINPLPPDLAWIRGMDTEPVLTTLDQINKFEVNLKKRRSQVWKRD